MNNPWKEERPPWEACYEVVDFHGTDALVLKPEKRWTESLSPEGIYAQVHGEGYSRQESGVSISAHGLLVPWAAIMPKGFS